MANTKVTSSLIADNAIGIDQLNVSDGTNGQALVTDGAGTLSFSTIQGYTDSDVESYLDGGTSTPTFSSVGIAGTPSGEASAAHVLRLGDRITIAEYDDGSNPEQFNLFHNASSSETYRETGYATNIQQRNGEITFKTAASGTAGSAITFSDRMKINNDGNVGIGTTTTFSNPLTLNKAAGAAGSLNNQLALTHTGASTAYHIKTIRAAATDEPAGLAFLENTTERLRIASDGTVYFGPNGSTSDPRITRHANGYDYINSGDSRWLKVGASSGHTNVAFQDGASGVTIFETAGSERVRIDSSGSLSHWDSGQFTRRRTHFNQGLGTYTASNMTADTNQEAPWVGFNDLGFVSLRGFAPYIDIKTNYTANNLMFMFKFEGYLYNRGNSVFYGGGYTYNGGVISKDIGATQAVLGPAYVYELYRASSDSALCIKVHANVANATYDEGKIAVSLFTFGELSTFRIASVRITDSTANYY